MTRSRQVGYINRIIYLFVLGIHIEAHSRQCRFNKGGDQGQTATLGDLAGFERDGRHFEMVDGTPYDGDKGEKCTNVVLLTSFDHDENLTSPCCLYQRTRIARYEA
jgi:hypothetical protein